MELKLLAVGDIMGDSGIDFLSSRLRHIQEEYGVHFTVVNGENASGVGMTLEQGERIFLAGADVITLGNHTWNRMQIVPALKDNRYLLRPANFSENAPGQGMNIYDGPEGLRIAVVDLIGRCELDFNSDNPFTKADSLLDHLDADVIAVDFHAEATSEKNAMAWYLDGRVQALWGTHTHVPTADARVMPNGTGFVTDLGFTGPSQSVLGMRPKQAINRFLGMPPTRFEVADGPCLLNSALFTIDTEKKRCLSVERIDEYE